MLETKSKCTGCQLTKYNFQIYSFLEFPLEQVNIFMFQMGRRFNMMNQGQNPDIDLLECFEYYQKIDNFYGPGSHRYFYSKEEWDAYNNVKDKEPDYMVDRNTNKMVKNNPD